MLSRKEWEKIAWGTGIAAAAIGLGYVFTRPRSASVPSGCVPQAPQDFLIRSNYVKDRRLFDRAVAYRTQNYGYFPGFGDRALNATSPAQNAEKTTFFGIPITMNRRVIPVLRCVETSIREECGDTYRPKALSGLRDYNSYHGYEVSNHVYGIAIDIDPNLNPCCGCVGHWADDPICKQPDTGPYSRMAMPECWVHVFERYGFYWLGRDSSLRDTMHFEFLGIPPT